MLGLAVAALWLMALPGLLRRDGLRAPEGGCRYAAYRDPVTGRSTLVAQARPAVAAPSVDPCLQAIPGVRK